MIGITQPIVKHSIAIERPDDVAQAVVDAIHIATSGPARAGADRPAGRHRRRARARRAGARAVPARLPPARAAERAPDARAPRRRSRRRGGRCSTPAAASSTPTRRASCASSRRLTGAPVTTTLMALGAFPASRPAVARDARHARHAASANWAMDEADLIVAVGARFDDRVTGAIDEFAPRREDRPHRHRRRPRSARTSPRTSRSSATPSSRWQALADAYGKLAPTERRLALVGADRGWQRGAPAAARAGDGCVDPRPRSTRCTTRSRRHDRHHRRRPAPDVGGQPPALRARRGAGSPAAGSGTMGFGLPAALGAAGAAPGRDRRVRVRRGLVPDERAGARDRRRGARCRSRSCCSTTRSLGMVRQQQDMFWGGRRSAVDLGATPDWELLAPRVRRGRRARSATATSRGRAGRDAGRAARRCCTSRSLRRPTACRCSGPAAPPGR